MIELAISDLSSLNFHNVWRAPEQEEVTFMQRVGPTDPIRVQFGISAAAQVPNIYLVNRQTGATSTLSPVQVDASDEYRYYNINQIIPTLGCYRLEFHENGGLLAYAEFQVTDNLEGTKLFQYNNYRSGGGVVFISGDPFYARLEARLFPQNISFGGESNTFRDQAYALRMLSANPVTTYKFYFGGDCGAPIWYGNKINRIFSLSEVLVDGDEYVKSDGAAVEVQTIDNSYPKFNFTLDLEKTRDGAKTVPIANISDDTPFPIEIEVVVVEAVSDTPAFDIDTVWLEVDHSDTTEKIVAVTAPDSNWSVFAADSSWLTATKDGQTAIITLTENDAADREQDVTFIWTDPNTSQVHTLTLHVYQLANDEVANQLNFTVPVLFSLDQSVATGTEVVMVDTVTSNTLATGTVTGGPLTLTWSATQAQYDATTIQLQATYPNEPTAVITLSNKPTYMDAVAGTTLDTLYIVENVHPIEVEVEVVETISLDIPTTFIVSGTVYPTTTAGATVTLYDGMTTEVLGTATTDFYGVFRISFTKTQRQWACMNSDGDTPYRQRLAAICEKSGYVRSGVIVDKPRISGSQNEIDFSKNIINIPQFTLQPTSSATITSSTMLVSDPAGVAGPWDKATITSDTSWYVDTSCAAFDNMTEFAYDYGGDQVRLGVRIPYSYSSGAASRSFKSWAVVYQGSGSTYKSVAIEVTTPNYE